MADLELTAAEEEYFRTGDASAVLDEIQDAEDERAEEQAQSADSSPPPRPRGEVVYEDGRWISKSERGLRAQMREEKYSHARTAERLNMLSQAIAPPQPQPAPEQMPEPLLDPVTDPVRAIREHHERFSRFDQQLAEQQWLDAYRADGMRFAQQHDPEYLQAYTHVMASRTTELMAQRFPSLSHEQLIRTPIPQDLYDQVLSEERDFAEEYLARGESPAAGWYQQAIIRGFESSKMKAARAENERRQAEAARKDAARKQREAEQREDEEFRQPMTRRLQAMTPDRGGGRAGRAPY